jgi:UDP-N-acetylglucosamine/UDP-N-acetyl-alpha-D-glucosaminouronate 4-epimerase
MSRYLVTGGAGFIGSNLAHALLARGDQVRVLDNFLTGREENLRGAKVELIRGDLRDLDTVMKAADGADFILHQGALPSVQRSVEDPIETNGINIGGTLHVLEAARKQKVKRVVFAASSSAYGESPTLPKVETMLPSPLSPYAVSKLTGEHYMAAYYTCYGVETVALRYFNVFGPRQDPNSHYAAVIPRFITAYLRGEPATIYGDGQQSRDFCFIENAVQANLLACTAKGAAGKVFNVACGARVTLLDVIDKLGEIFGKRIEPRFEAPRPGDIKHSLADISAAQKVLGYTAPVSFEEGLRRTVDWFRR